MRGRIVIEPYTTIEPCTFYKFSFKRYKKDGELSKNSDQTFYSIRHFESYLKDINLFTPVDEFSK